MKMIAKFTALVCLFSVVRGSGWDGGLGYASSIGYGLGGYSNYVSPSYTAPIVTAPVITKAAIPAYSYGSYAPAISTVSRYQVHSTPIVKSYVAAPIVKSYVSPISYASYSPYGSVYDHNYSNIGYNTGYIGGYSGYGVGGYSSKYIW